MDSQGRLFVADRGNHRIQIFDQEGKFLQEFKQFSRISGLFITPNDMLYAIDSESSPERHPNWKTGIRIGSTKEDKVLQFIPPHEHRTAARRGRRRRGGRSRRQRLWGRRTDLAQGRRRRLDQVREVAKRTGVHSLRRVQR